MKKVMQDKFGDEGNCMEACIASILEIPLDEVPYSVPYGEKWMDILHPFLFDRGLYLITVDAEIFLKIKKPYGYSIGAGRSSRVLGFDHAVVCLDGETVHDPHPDPDPVEITEFSLFVSTMRE